jgi:hypothetical protein
MSLMTAASRTCHALSESAAEIKEGKVRGSSFPRATRRSTDWCGPQPQVIADRDDNSLSCADADYVVLWPGFAGLSAHALHRRAPTSCHFLRLRTAAQEPVSERLVADVPADGPQRGVSGPLRRRVGPARPPRR